MFRGVIRGKNSDFSRPIPPQRLFEMPRIPPMLRVVDSKDAKLSFETALTKLETIVESMESGEVPLAELLAKFEEGNKLLKLCEARLKEAELKIARLRLFAGAWLLRNLRRWHPRGRRARV